MTEADLFVDPRNNSEWAVGELRTTVAVRDRCGQLLARARQGLSGWFEVDEDALDAVAREVAQTLRERHGHAQVPRLGQWRHFEAGGVDRRRSLMDLLAGQDKPARARCLIDLAVVAALAGTHAAHRAAPNAGAPWRYTEPATGQTFTQADGLAVATFHAFVAGLFSGDPGRPLQADAIGLRALAEDQLAEAFQSSPANPLPQLGARCVLLRRLGEVMSQQPEVFGEDARPGGLFDMLVSPLGPSLPHTADIDVHDILWQLLQSLSGIWPDANHLGGLPLGDCWRHPAVRGPGETDGWVPFHQRSQYLTYCLLEPFQWCGVQVRGEQHLTGLPDARHCGLFVDSGALRLRDPEAAMQTWHAGDEIIVEWRALAVALLDELAPRVRRLLRRGDDALPMASLLEGGTCVAGREMAQRLRGGLPPLRVAGAATVL